MVIINVKCLCRGYHYNTVLCFRDNMPVDWKLDAVTHVTLKRIDSEL